MTHPSVHVQIAPTSVPSTPSWLGEVAVLAHVFSQLGLQKAIEERVRFARARMGDYEVIDFVVMLMGYAVSGERTLQSFYQRLLPFAEPFMALFGRANLPHAATLSRFLAALDQAPVEALRTLFQEDLVARSAFASAPGGVWDRLGGHWTVVDVDGTKQAVRQRALPQTAERASRPIAALSWSRRPHTWDANGEKSHARERRSCKRIRINGWARSATQAMVITGGNCCEPER
jgi:hypothetical protein